MLKKKGEQSEDVLVFLRRGNKNIHRREYKDKVWSRDRRKGHPETAPPGDPAHIQPPNSDKKFMLTGAGYSCLLRGSARS